MKNELGALKSIRNCILTGYGYNQMLDKVGISEEELSELCIKYPDFGNEINRRYNKIFAKKEKTTIDSNLSKVEESRPNGQKGRAENGRTSKRYSE